MKYIYLLLPFLFLCFSETQLLGQQNRTLEEVLELVKKQSFATKTAAHQLNIAEEANRFYRSQLKPSLGLWGNLPRFSKTSSPVIQPDGSLSFQSIRQANSSISLYAEQLITKTGGTLFINTDLQRFDNFDSNFKQYNGIPVRVGFRQSIIGYNPWKYDNNIQALLLEEATKTFHIQTEEALAQATDLYFNILIAEQNLDIASTNEEVNQKLLRITEERLELGKVSKDEKLQLEIELNAAKLAVSLATNELEQATSQLSVFLGQATVDENVSYQQPNLIASPTVDINQLLQSFYKNRPEIIAHQRRLTANQQDLAKAKADYGVQINVAASIGLAKGAPTVEAIYQNPFDEQQFNLSFQIPILDWGKKNAAMKQIKIQHEDLQAFQQQQILEFENNIRQAAATFTRLQNDIFLLKEMLKHADERFNISNERYILGNIDITNLTLAQREKDQTKRNYINALKAYWQSYFQIKILTGFDVRT